jgi:hypothetical protein
MPTRPIAKDVKQGEPVGVGQFGDLWAEKDEKITFGYINEMGERIPGILEMIDKHSLAIKVAQNIDVWLLRIIGLVVMLHYFGISTLADLVRLFTH